MVIKNCLSWIFIEQKSFKLLRELRLAADPIWLKWEKKGLVFNL